MRWLLRGFLWGIVSCFFFFFFAFFCVCLYYWTKKKGGIFCSLDTFILHQTYTFFFLTLSFFFFFLGIGNFVGPFIFLEREHPKYGTGFAITWITAAISGLLAIAYRYECIRDNRARNASGCREAFDHAFEDPTDKAVSSSIALLFLFFFARGLIRMLTTYVLFFGGKSQNKQFRYII